MRTQEKDLLSMLNFSSSSCGALQLINTNKHNFVNFLSVYSKDNAFSNSVSSVIFHPLDYFSLLFGSSFAIKLQEAVLYPIRPRLQTLPTSSFNPHNLFSSPSLFR